MDKYSVILYPRAFRDIDDIYAYIAHEKMSPENAKGQTDRIWHLNNCLNHIRIVWLGNLLEKDISN